MKKSGLADSPFFLSSNSNTEESKPVSSGTPEKPFVEATVSPMPEFTAIQSTPVHKPLKKRKIVLESPVSTTKTLSEKEDVMNASLQASSNASMHASNQPLTHETIIETIRKAVKDVGKDSATYRFTPEEKMALLELSFSYKMQGYKTSENELTRIAINFLLEDQRENGKNSVLQRVLDALDK
jgi:hypothetical protein